MKNQPNGLPVRPSKDGLMVVLKIVNYGKNTLK
jgi:hypothetical protein